MFIVYCDQSQQRSGHASKPQSLELIIAVSAGLVFHMPEMLLLISVFSVATFSNEDENEDEDWYDRLGPGTRTSSTAVFRRETKTFSKPVTVRGRVFLQ